jgi:hypothetical protein
MIIVAVLVGLLVVLFFVGVGLGAARHDSGAAIDSWLSRLRGLDAAATLDPAQLTTVGACSIDVATSRLQVNGPCAVRVPAAGLFALRPRRLVLAPVGEDVTFVTRVQDLQETGTIKAGETKKVGVGRGSQDIAIACADLPPCVVLLPH